jgi:hypothetical protein
VGPDPAPRAQTLGEIPQNTLIVPLDPAARGVSEIGACLRIIECEESTPW